MTGGLENLFKEREKKKAPARCYSKSNYPLLLRVMMHMQITGLEMLGELCVSLRLQCEYSLSIVWFLLQVTGHTGNAAINCRARLG